MQIQQIENAAHQLQALINNKKTQYQEEQEKLARDKQVYEKLLIDFRGLQCSLEIYEQLLQPLQDSINQLRDKLESIEEFPSELLKNQEEQSEVLSQMESMINLLTGGSGIQMI
jgi:chromosome segregation ATPase